MPLISVIIPIYNEEENLPILIPLLDEALKSLGKLFEIIFVDDGSTDGSRKILKEMISQYPQMHPFISSKTLKAHLFL